MNFFEYQDKARKKTFFLVFGFLLSILLIVLLIDGMLLLYRYSLQLQHNVALYDSNPLLGAGFGVINALICIILLLGSIAKYFSLRAGGASIVAMMNATPIDRDHPSPSVKQLIDVVDEISIASGVVAPMIYVLNKEKGINAFVAGYNPNDTVLVVTRGALDNLSRDEMQGVIAHEYSHIFNSDTSLNLRLLIILAGLFGISQVGNVMLRSRDNNQVVVVLGLILLILGFIGVLFGNIIKAAISRQRETLADASAVQYTRDPNGIARALLKIEQQGKDALMQNTKAEQVNHMCFSKARAINLFGMFADHPKLELRIAMLDPTGEIRAAFMQTGDEKRPVAPSPTPATTQATAQTMVNTMLTGTVLVASDKIVTSIGNPTVHSLSHAETILNSLPPALKAMLNSDITIQALMYAIAIKMGNGTEFDKVKGNISQAILVSITQCLDYPEITHAPYRAILINMALPTLKKLSDIDKKVFLKNIYLLLETDMNLPKALMLTVLNQRMNIDAYKRLKFKYSSFDKIANEAACILWYMAKQANVDVNNQNQAFQNSMQILDNNFAKSIQDFNFDVHQLIKSLIKLRLMKPDLKQQFLSACVNCIVADRKVNMNELELLRAICTCLDCPLPLLHPSAVNS